MEVADVTQAIDEPAMLMQIDNCSRPFTASSFLSLISKLIFFIHVHIICSVLWLLEHFLRQNYDASNCDFVSRRGLNHRCSCTLRTVYFQEVNVLESIRFGSRLLSSSLFHMGFHFTACLFFVSARDSLSSCEDQLCHT